jgi:hypothetical protein
MELEVQRLGIEMATALKCIRKLTRTKIVRLLLVVFAGVPAAGVVDLARAWALGSVVKPFSSRAIARLPNALSTSAIMRF